MKGWLRSIRGALGLGLIWGVGGAAIGALIELTSNIFPGLELSFIDMWIPSLAVPGFLGGVIFSTVLRITAGHRRLDELSLPHVGFLGAVGGGLLGALLMAMGWSPLILVPTTLLSVLGASITLTLAKTAERRELVEADQEAIGPG